jgi:hypothetical protein
MFLERVDNIIILVRINEKEEKDRILWDGKNNCNQS